MRASSGGNAQGDEQMLLDWLKKDLSKDVAAKHGAIARDRSEPAAESPNRRHVLRQILFQPVQQHLLISLRVAPDDVLTVLPSL